VIKWSYQEGNEERCAAWFMRENKRREGLFHLLPFFAFRECGKGE
jgi:hypothetical protein